MKSLEVLERRNSEANTYPRQHLVPLVNELPDVGDDPRSHLLQLLPPKVGIADAHLVQHFGLLNLNRSQRGRNVTRTAGRCRKEGHKPAGVLVLLK